MVSWSIWKRSSDHWDWNHGHDRLEGSYTDPCLPCEDWRRFTWGFQFNQLKSWLNDVKLLFMNFHLILRKRFLMISDCQTQLADSGVSYGPYARGLWYLGRHENLLLLLVKLVKFRRNYHGFQYISITYASYAIKVLFAHTHTQCCGYAMNSCFCEV